MKYPFTQDDLERLIAEHMATDYLKQANGDEDLARELEANDLQRIATIRRYLHLSETGESETA